MADLNDLRSIISDARNKSQGGSSNPLDDARKTLAAYKAAVAPGAAPGSGLQQQDIVDIAAQEYTGVVDWAPEQGLIPQAKPREFIRGAAEVPVLGAYAIATPALRARFIAAVMDWMPYFSPGMPRLPEPVRQEFGRAVSQAMEPAGSGLSAYGDLATETVAMRGAAQGLRQGSEEGGWAEINRLAGQTSGQAVAVGAAALLGPGAIPVVGMVTAASMAPYAYTNGQLEYIADLEAERADQAMNGEPLRMFDYGEMANRGLTSMAIETGVEVVGAGVGGKIVKNILKGVSAPAAKRIANTRLAEVGKRMLDRISGSPSATVATRAFESVTNNTLEIRKGFLGKAAKVVLASGTEEGAEELASGVLNAPFTYAPLSEDLTNALKSGMMGFVAGGAMAGTTIGASATRTAVLNRRDALRPESDRERMLRRIHDDAFAGRVRWSEDLTQAQNEELSVALGTINGMNQEERATFLRELRDREVDAKDKVEELLRQRQEVDLALSGLQELEAKQQADMPRLESERAAKRELVSQAQRAYEQAERDLAAAQELVREAEAVVNARPRVARPGRKVVSREEAQAALAEANTMVERSRMTVQDAVAQVEMAEGLEIVPGVNVDVNQKRSELTAQLGKLDDDIITAIHDKIIAETKASAVSEKIHDMPAIAEQVEPKDVLAQQSSRLNDKIEEVAAPKKFRKLTDEMKALGVQVVWFSGKNIKSPAFHSRQTRGVIYLNANAKRDTIRAKAFEEMYHDLQMFRPDIAQKFVEAATIASIYQTGVEYAATGTAETAAIGRLDEAAMAQAMNAASMMEGQDPSISTATARAGAARLEHEGAANAFARAAALVPAGWLLAPLSRIGARAGLFGRDAYAAMSVIDAVSRAAAIERVNGSKGDATLSPLARTLLWSQTADISYARQISEDEKQARAAAAEARLAEARRIVAGRIQERQVQVTEKELEEAQARRAKVGPIAKTPALAKIRKILTGTKGMKEGARLAMAQRFMAAATSMTTLSFRPLTPAEYLAGHKRNKATLTLTQYSLTQISNPSVEVQDGKKVRVSYEPYGIPGLDVAYMLKRVEYLDDSDKPTGDRYDEAVGLYSNEGDITDVVAPVMLHAISRYPDVEMRCDCYDVRRPGQMVAQGKLPSSYKMFGFVADVRQAPGGYSDWNPAYLSPPEGMTVDEYIDTMVKYWKSEGWVPELDSDGRVINYPGVWFAKLNLPAAERLRLRDTGLAGFTADNGRLARIASGAAAGDAPIDIGVDAEGRPITRVAERNAGTGAGNPEGDSRRTSADYDVFTGNSRRVSLVKLSNAIRRELDNLTPEQKGRLLSASQWLPRAVTVPEGQKQRAADAAVSAIAAAMQRQISAEEDLKDVQRRINALRRDLKKTSKKVGKKVVALTEQEIAQNQVRLTQLKLGEDMSTLEQQRAHISAEVDALLQMHYKKRELELHIKSLQDMKASPQEIKKISDIAVRLQEWRGSYGLQTQINDAQKRIDNINQKIRDWSLTEPAVVELMQARKAVEDARQAVIDAKHSVFADILADRGITSYRLTGGRSYSLTEVQSLFDAFAQSIVGWINEYTERNPMPRDLQVVIMRSLVEDLKYAATKAGNESALEWYGRLIDQMWEAAAKKYPALSDTASDDRRVFAMMLSITSQGEKVQQNALLTRPLFEEWVANGKQEIVIPASFDARHAGAMVQNFDKLNVLFRHFGSWAEVERFLLTKDVVKNHNALLRKTKVTVNGQQVSMAAAIGLISDSADDQTYMSSVLGPKIGSFYNNVHKRFDTLTADVWFTRTFFRPLGGLRRPDATAVRSAVQDIARELAKARSILLAERTTENAAEQDIAAKVVELVPPDALSDPARLEEIARAFNRDFVRDPNNRMIVGTTLKLRQKSPAEGALVRYAKALDASAAAPESNYIRSLMRSLVQEAIDTVKVETGLEYQLADAQAGLWYTEKELYAAFGAADDPAGQDYRQAVEAAMAMDLNAPEVRAEIREAVAASDAAAAQQAAVVATEETTTENAESYARDEADQVELVRTHAAIRNELKFLQANGLDPLSFAREPSERVMAMVNDGGWRFIGVRGENKPDPIYHNTDEKAMVPFDPEKHAHSTSRICLTTQSIPMPTFGTYQMRFYVIAQKPLFIPCNGNSWAKIPVKDLPESLWQDLSVGSDNINGYRQADDIAIAARKAGYDATVFTQVADDYGVHDEINVYSRANLISTHTGETLEWQDQNLWRQGGAIPPFSDMKPVGTLPGSTAPQLYEDANGGRWVVKDGRSQAHLKSELDGLHSLLFLNESVPLHAFQFDRLSNKFRLVVKYVDGSVTLGEYMSRMRENGIDFRTTKPFVLINHDFLDHVLIRNWDMFGMNNDNILVDPATEEVTYIDAGGTFEYRAQGERKFDVGEQTAFVTDLRNMLRFHADKIDAPSSREIVAYLLRRGQRIYHNRRTTMMDGLPDAMYVPAPLEKAIGNAIGFFTGEFVDSSLEVVNKYAFAAGSKFDRFVAHASRILDYWLSLDPSKPAMSVDSYERRAKNALAEITSGRLSNRQAIAGVVEAIPPYPLDPNTDYSYWQSVVDAWKAVLAAPDVESYFVEVMRLRDLTQVSLGGRVGAMDYWMASSSYVTRMLSSEFADEMFGTKTVEKPYKSEAHIHPKIRDVFEAVVGMGEPVSVPGSMKSWVYLALSQLKEDQTDLALEFARAVRKSILMSSSEISPARLSQFSQDIEDFSRIVARKSVQSFFEMHDSTKTELLDSPWRTGPYPHQATFMLMALNAEPSDMASQFVLLGVRHLELFGGTETLEDAAWRMFSASDKLPNKFDARHNYFKTFFDINRQSLQATLREAGKDNTGSWTGSQLVLFDRMRNLYQTAFNFAFIDYASTENRAKYELEVASKSTANDFAFAREASDEEVMSLRAEIAALQRRLRDTENTTAAQRANALREVRLLERRLTAATLLAEQKTGQAQRAISRLQRAMAKNDEDKAAASDASARASNRLEALKARIDRLKQQVRDQRQLTAEARDALDEAEAQMDRVSNWAYAIGRHEGLVAGQVAGMQQERRRNRTYRERVSLLESRYATARENLRLANERIKLDALAAERAVNLAHQFGLRDGLVQGMMRGRQQILRKMQQREDTLQRQLDSLRIASAARADDIASIRSAIQSIAFDAARMLPIRLRGPLATRIARANTIAQANRVAVEAMRIAINEEARQQLSVIRALRRRMNGRGMRFTVRRNIEALLTNAERTLLNANNRRVFAQMASVPSRQRMLHVVGGGLQRNVPAGVTVPNAVRIYGLVTAAANDVQAAMLLYQQDHDTYVTAQQARVARYDDLTTRLVGAMANRATLQDRERADRPPVQSIARQLALADSDIYTLMMEVEGTMSGVVNEMLTAAQEGKGAAGLEHAQVIRDLEPVLRQAGYAGLDDYALRNGLSGSSIAETIAVTLGGTRHVLPVGVVMSIAAMDDETLALFVPPADPAAARQGMQFSGAETTLTVYPTDAEIRSLRTNLTPGQRAMIDEMKNILETRIRDRVMEAVFLVEGDQPPVVENYWPRIRNMDEFRGESRSVLSRHGTLVRSALTSVGFANAREGGNSPLIYRDAFQTFERHVQVSLDMIHMAQPYRDAATVLTRPEVVERIDRQMGRGTAEAILSIFSNGVGATARGATNKIDRLTNNVTSAVLSLSPRTAAKVVVGGTIRLASELPGEYWAIGAARAAGMLRSPRDLWQARVNEVHSYSGYFTRRHQLQMRSIMSGTLSPEDRVRVVTAARGFARAVAAAGHSAAARNITDALEAMGDATDSGNMVLSALIDVLRLMDEHIMLTAVEGRLSQVDDEGMIGEEAFREAVRRAERDFRLTQNASDEFDETAFAAVNRTRGAGATWRMVFPFSSDPLKARNQIRRAWLSGNRRLGTTVAITGNVASSTLISVASTVTVAYVAKAIASAIGGADEPDDAEDKRFAEAVKVLPASIVSELIGAVFGYLGLAMATTIQSYVNRRAMGQALVARPIEQAGREMSAAGSMTLNVTEAMLALAQLRGIPLYQFYRFVRDLIPEPVETPAERMRKRYDPEQMRKRLLDSARRAGQSVP